MLPLSVGFLAGEVLTTAYSPNIRVPWSPVKDYAVESETRSAR